MALFDFLKPKQKPINEIMEKMMNSIFPKGQKDIDAGTIELVYILNNKIDYNLSKSIFLKAVVISRISEKFDKERLRAHLAGYCLHYFDESQVEKFYNYLTALSAAMMIHRRTPSEVRRVGDAYIW